jgi:hypothetical protein
LSARVTCVTCESLRTARLRPAQSTVLRRGRCDIGHALDTCTRVSFVSLRADSQSNVPHATGKRPNVPDMAPGMRLQRARHDARHATATRQGAMLSGQPRVAYCPQYSPHASPACTPQASRPRHRAWSHAPDRITQTSVTAPRPEGGARPTAGGFVGEMARGFVEEMARGFVEEMESRGFGGWAR